MKIIEYNYMNINYLKFMNEVWGVIGQRNKLLKNPSKTPWLYIFVLMLNVIKLVFIYFIAFWIILDLEELLDINTEFILDYWTYFMIIFLIYYLLKNICFFVKLAYQKIRNGNKTYKVSLDEKGIMDYDTDLKVPIFCEWNKIIRLVQTKTAIILFTKEKNVNFYYPKDERIINEIKKYKKDLFLHIV